MVMMAQVVTYVSWWHAIYCHAVELEHERPLQHTGKQEGYFWPRSNPAHVFHITFLLPTWSPGLDMYP